MNYELAKQLKDAGFPQDGKGQFVDIELASPTLSELIEACGDGFDALYNQKSEWQAEANGKYGEGSTPEEAVAKLWLELNKTKVGTLQS